MPIEPRQAKEIVARAIATEVSNRLRHTLTDNTVTAYIKLREKIDEAKNDQRRLIQEIVDNARDRGMI